MQQNMFNASLKPVKIKDQGRAGNFSSEVFLLIRKLFTRGANCSVTDDCFLQLQMSMVNQFNIIHQDLRIKKNDNTDSFIRNLLDEFNDKGRITFAVCGSTTLFSTRSHLLPTSSLHTESFAYLSISFNHCFTLLKLSISVTS